MCGQQQLQRRRHGQRGGKRQLQLAEFPQADVCSQRAGFFPQRIIALASFLLQPSAQRTSVWESIPCGETSPPTLQIAPTTEDAQYSVLIDHGHTHGGEGGRGQGTGCPGVERGCV